MIINEKTLQRLRENTAFCGAWSEAIAQLKAVGVIDFLRDVGRVGRIFSNTPNYRDAQASECVWSSGYNDALDHLLNFREMFIEAEVKQAKPMPAPDFGAFDIALRKDDLTKEEADDIRTGKPVRQLYPHPRDVK